MASASGAGLGEGLALLEVSDAASVQELEAIAAIASALTQLSSEAQLRSPPRRHEHGMANPFPGVACSEGALSAHPEQLPRFVARVFCARYFQGSRSDGQLGLHLSCSNLSLDIGALSESLAQQSISSESLQEESDRQETLRSICDDLIMWLWHQEFSAALLDAFIFAVQEAAALDAPVARNRLFVHVLGWLDCPICAPAVQQHFDAVQTLLIIGLTDIWSAIRNGCAKLLSALLDHLGLQCMEPLFLALIKICDDPASSWQATEGALHGITVIIRKFQWVARHPEAHSGVGRLVTGATDTIADRTEFELMFGAVALPDGLPDFITDNLRRCVFSTLAHPQLSIREHCTKAFSAYLSRSQFKEALVALKEVVLKLRGEDRPHAEDQGKEQEPFRFLDAYEAEGLLGVCTFILKHLQSGFLLPNWPMYFTTFDLYLMHPASTVRQAASTVFKFLVAKDSSNPIMLKLVLQGLAANWRVSEEALTTASMDQAFISQRLPSTQNLGKPDGPRRAHDTWEWKEGRMLAYELILRFLITNHVHYLFPTTMLGSEFSQKPVAGKKAPRRLLKLAGLGRMAAANTGVRAGSSWDAMRRLSDTDFEVPDLPHKHSRAQSLEVPREVEALTTATCPDTVPKLRPPPDAPKSPVLVKGISFPALRRLKGSGRERASSDAEPIMPNFQKPPLKKKTSTTSLSPPRSPSPPLVEEGTATPIEGEVQQQESEHKPFAGRRLSRQTSWRSRALHEQMKDLDKVKPNQPFRSTSRSLGRLQEERLHQTMSLISRVAALEEMHYKTSAAAAKTTTLEERDDDNDDEGSRGVGEPRSNKDMLVSALRLPPRIPLAEACVAARPSCPGVSYMMSPAIGRRTNGTQASGHETAGSGGANGKVLWGSALDGLSPATQRRLSQLSCPAWADPLDQENPDWVDTSKFENFLQVLYSILFQTAECMGSQRFELRRIGGMVLPLLAEVIRWFDCDGLLAVWDTCLPMQGSWMALVASETLRHSMAHVAWLTSFFKNPPSSWKHPGACHAASLKVVTTVKLSLQSTFPGIIEEAQKSPFCKLNAEALDLMMLLLTSFRDCVPQPTELESVLVNELVLLYARAFGSNPVFDAAVVERAKTTSTLESGILSCACKVAPTRQNRAMGSKKLAEQALGFVLEQCHELLCDFVDICSLQVALSLGPLLLRFSCSISADEKIAKACNEALHRLLDRAGALVWRSSALQPAVQNELPLQSTLITVCDLSVKKICAHIQNKDCDVAARRRLLEMYRTILIALPFQRYVTSALEAVAEVTRMSSTVVTPAGVIDATSSSWQMLGSTSVTCLSAPQDSESDDEEHSQSKLDLSHGHASISAANADDSDSDWDSDEDEESDEATLMLLKEFLDGMGKVLKSSAVQARMEQPSATCFSDAVQTLSGPDKAAINWLMKTFQE